VAWNTLHGGSAQDPADKAGVGSSRNMLDEGARARFRTFHGTLERRAIEMIFSVTAIICAARCAC